MATLTTSQTVTFPAEPGEEPVSVTAAVMSIQRREENGVYGRMVGLDARLHVTLPGDTAPHSYFLSRLVDERDWVQDALFGPTGYPHFSDGFGARYTKLTGIAPELEALLDQAALQLGLAEQIGPDLPLVLAAAAAPAVTDGQAGA